MSDPALTPQPPQMNNSAAATIVQSIASAPPVPPQPQVSARAKEQVVPSETTTMVETAQVKATPETEPIPPEVEAWMEKVGGAAEEVNLDNLPPVEVAPPTTQAPASSPPAFVLPLGEAEMQAGLHAGVNDSIRWLATWCQRIFKQLRGQIVFRG